MLYLSKWTEVICFVLYLFKIQKSVWYLKYSKAVEGGHAPRSKSSYSEEETQRLGGKTSLGWTCVFVDRIIWSNECLTHKITKRSRSCPALCYAPDISK